MPRVRKLRVLAVSVPAALVILAGTALADPLVAESCGLDAWTTGGRQLDEATRAGDRLDAEAQRSSELMALNQLILDDVSAGRLSLATAARQKWEINRDRVGFREHLQEVRNAPTDEAKMAQDIVAMVCGAEPSLRPHLEAEYAAAYGTSLPPAGSK